MKKIIVFAVLLILSASSFSQQEKRSAGLSKEDYLQKSGKQKRAANIMLGGGAVLLITGIVIPKGAQMDTDEIYPFFTVTSYRNDGIRAALAITGILSMLGSVPVYIASGKNKRRAMAISFKNERTVQMQKGAFVHQPVPSITIKLSL
jgi:hypothetical protein